MPKTSKTSHIPTVQPEVKIGPFKQFLLSSGLTYRFQIMSQRALIPESLTNRDVEVRKLSRRPPLSFVPSEKGESGKDKTTVKVKINDDLVESVEPFDGTSPEQYMNLMDIYAGIARKKCLAKAVSEAVDNLKVQKSIWDLHVTGKPPRERENDLAQPAPAPAPDQQANKAADGDDGVAPVSPDKAKTGGGGRNAGLTVLQTWQAEGAILKEEVKKATEARDKAIAAVFSVFESILGVAASGRWERIVAKICTGRGTTDEQSSDGRSVSRFRFCQRELMLEVFEQDAAERQREYMLFHLKMSWKVTLRAWVTRIQHLSRLTTYLPCLADSAEAPQGLERANRALSPQELCALIMRAIPTEWRDQYRLMAGSTLVPVDVEKLVIDLSNIEQLEATRKRKMDNANDRIPKKQRTGGNGGGGGNGGKATKRNGGGGGKRCELCAKYGGASTTHHTKDCKKWTADGEKKADFSAFKGKNGSGGGGRQQKKPNWKKNFLQLTKKLGELDKKLAGKKKRKQRTDDDSSSDDE